MNHLPVSELSLPVGRNAGQRDRFHRVAKFLGLLLFSLRVWAGPFRDTGDGVSVREDSVPSGPWAISIVRFERSRTNLTLMPTLGDGRRLGLGTLTEQIAAVPPELGTPLAAINGDFYRTEQEPFSGDPRGLLIAGGELLSAPAERECFWIDTNGVPHIGFVRASFAITWPDGSRSPLGLNGEPDGDAAVLFTPAGAALGRQASGARLTLQAPTNGPWLPVRAGESVSAVVAADNARRTNRMTLVLPGFLRRLSPPAAPGQSVRLSFDTTPDLRGVPTALGGGSALVRDGKVQPARAVKSNVRHPRSALGWNAEHFFLVTVDGRQPGWSDGMTLPELANYLQKLGCTEAINLDGGGSTELWLRGAIVNRPCYGHERQTATGLVLVLRPTRR